KHSATMECGVSAGGYTNGTPPTPNPVSLHMMYEPKVKLKERFERNFLTAKYGNHQMSLIRKRLAVEMWLYEESCKVVYDTVSSIPNFNILGLLDLWSESYRKYIITYYPSNLKFGMELAFHISKTKF
ncbi:hypothetical protein RN001_016462, partial [Aquatica leii]